MNLVTPKVGKVNNCTFTANDADQVENKTVSSSPSNEKADKDNSKMIWQMMAISGTVAAVAAGILLHRSKAANKLLQDAQNNMQKDIQGMQEDIQGMQEVIKGTVDGQCRMYRTHSDGIVELIEERNRVWLREFQESLDFCKRLSKNKKLLKEKFGIEPSGYISSLKDNKNYPYAAIQARDGSLLVPQKYALDRSKRYIEIPSDANISEKSGISEAIGDRRYVPYEKEAWILNSDNEAWQGIGVAKEDIPEVRRFICNYKLLDNPETCDMLPFLDLGKNPKVLHNPVKDNGGFNFSFSYIQKEDGTIFKAGDMSNEFWQYKPINDSKAVPDHTKNIIELSNGQKYERIAVYRGFKQNSRLEIEKVEGEKVTNNCITLSKEHSGTLANLIYDLYHRA